MCGLILGSRPDGDYRGAERLDGGMSCRQLRQKIETASSAVVADEGDDGRLLEDQLVLVALVITQRHWWKLHWRQATS